LLVFETLQFFKEIEKLGLFSNVESLHQFGKICQNWNNLKNWGNSKKNRKLIKLKKIEKFEKKLKNKIF